MENAADALKIAFAILIFVIAITIVFTMISKVKSTADDVLFYADDTNYQQHVNSRETNRTVSKAEVVSALHRYNKESLAVTVRLGSDEYIFDRGIQGEQNRTEEEIEANHMSDRLQLFNSKNAAKEVAFRTANIPYQLGEEYTYVYNIVDEAKTTLKVGDDIQSVNGVKIGFNFFFGKHISVPSESELI